METYEIKVDTGIRKIKVHIADQEFSLNIAAHSFELHETPASYREIFSKIIWENIDSDIDQKPTVEEIAKQDDAWFVSLFDHFFAKDPQLKEKYDSLTDYSDVCERFEEAYYKRILSGIPESIERMYAKLQEIANSMTKAISNIDFSVLNDFAAYLSECVKSIHTPEISDKRKNELIENYKCWGKYGCTIPPNADIDCFSNPPQNLKEAENFILQYCDVSNMDNLFELLKEKRGNKNELTEAIACFRQGHRVACASILCSLIDARLIKLQGRNANNKKVGKGAKKLFESRIKQMIDNTPSIFIVLAYANLFECLTVLLDDTNNFKLDSKVINRNMLLHGMSRHPVRKIDCIKLFLLLYNLIEAIEIYRS